MVDKRSSNSRPPPAVGSPNNVTVDLGLSGLLSEAAATSPTAPPHKDSEQEVRPTERPSASQESEYVPRVLMAAGKWSELAAWCERGLSPKLTSSAPEEVWPRIERRVWWIRSQERLKGVPISILSAPLEEVSHEFLVHRESGRETLGAGVSEALQNELYKLLGELAEGLRSRGDEATASRLEDLKKRVGTTHIATTPQVRTDSAVQGAGDQPEAGATVDPLPAPPRIRAELTERLISDLPARGPKEAGRKAPHPGTSSGSTGKDRAITSTARWWLKALVITVLLLALVGVLLFQRLNVRSWRETLTSLGIGQTNPLAPQIPLPDGLKEPALQPPKLPEPRAPSQLEAILEDYRGAKVLTPQTDVSPRDSTDRPPAQAKEGDPSSSSAAPSSATVHQQANRQPLEPVVQQKETINTSGPLEPPHFPRAGDRRRDTEPSSGLSRGPRQPPPPTGQDSSPPRPERPGFENFTAPRVYRTLVETDVMSAPTIRGRALDVLPAGVEVLVEGKEGYWLRIRSQRGNRGFILSQDAVRVPSP